MFYLIIATEISQTLQDKRTSAYVLQTSSFILQEQNLFMNLLPDKLRVFNIVQCH